MFLARTHVPYFPAQVQLPHLLFAPSLVAVETHALLSLSVPANLARPNFPVGGDGGAATVFAVNEGDQVRTS